MGCGASKAQVSESSNKYAAANSIDDTDNQMELAVQASSAEQSAGGLTDMSQLRPTPPGVDLLSPNAVDPSEELFAEPTAEATPNDDGDDLAAFAEQLKSAQKSAKKRGVVIRRHGQEIIAEDSSNVAASGQGATQDNFDELGYRLPGAGDDNQFEMDSGAAGVSRTLFDQSSAHGQKPIAEDDFDFGSPQPSDALEHSAAEHGTALATTASPRDATAAQSGEQRQPSDLHLDEGMLQQGESSPGRINGILHRNESDPSPTQGGRDAPSFADHSPAQAPVDASREASEASTHSAAANGDE